MDEFKTHPPCPSSSSSSSRPPLPPRSFLSGAKGASPACRWLAGQGWHESAPLSLPPRPTWRLIWFQRWPWGKRYRRASWKTRRTLLRLPKVYSINPGSRNFLRLDWSVWGRGGGGLRDLARGIRPALDLFSDVYCSWIRVFRRVLIGFRAGGSFNELGITFAKTFFFFWLPLLCEKISRDVLVEIEYISCSSKYVSIILLVIFDHFQNQSRLYTYM